MPGVIQLEMIAQTSVALLCDNEDATPMYTGLNNVKFKHPLLPGDTAVMTVSITARKGIFCFAKGNLKANGNFAPARNSRLQWFPPKNKDKST